MKLSNVAAVRSGLVLSRKEARGTFRIRYPLLNLRCIKPEGYIDMDQIDIFDAADSLSPEYLSQVGDVVIRLTAPSSSIPTKISSRRSKRASPEDKKAG